METAGDRFYKEQLKKLDVRQKRLENNLIKTLCEIEDVDKSMMS